MTHIIRQQHLHVEMNGTECDGLALQRSLPELCQLLLIPALERVLDRYAPRNRHLTIERLEIDVGTLALERLEHDLTELVAQAVEKFLREQSPPPNKASSATISDNVQCKTEKQSIHEAFIYFLKTGSLPWSFRLSSGRTLEQVILDSWQEAKQSDAILRSINASIVKILASETVGKRLVRQFSSVFMDALLSHLSSEGKQAMDRILPVLRSSDVPSVDVKCFERQLWESAFAAVAMGSDMTEIKLVGEAWNSLPVPTGHLSALASLLERHWPGVMNKAFVYRHRFKCAETTRSESVEIEKKARATGEQLETWKDFNKDSTKKIKSIKQFPPEISVAEKKDVKIIEQPGLSENDQSSINVQSETKESIYINYKKNRINVSEQIDIKEGVYIDCAGLVLLHPFLPRFFEALDIAAEDQILQPDRALCLLHFLATGQSVAPEYELILPKILSNVPLEAPVESTMEFSVVELAEAAALLEAVIRHWAALRNTSVDGLRGTFLVRPGKLSLRDDGDWFLQVESKSYDILLDQLPWGIGMIKLPWMQLMLWVEWCN